MKENYEKGNYGYGHAKKELFDLVIEKYKKPRSKYFELIKNQDHIDKILGQGEIKAKKIACSVLERVRNKLGY